jgi:hypothetical protein
VLKDSLKDRIAHHTLQNNPVHLRTFAASLKEDGYSDGAMQSKVSLLANFGQWLRRSQMTVAHLDEQLVERFINYQQAVRRSDLKTFKQFLEHLRSRDVILDRPCSSDNSPLAEILRRYQEHLRSERGLVTSTVIGYETFIHKFLVERFRKGPLLFRELRSSDISDFVLRHAPTMSPRRAQLMTTAFRSFFRFLFRMANWKRTWPLVYPVSRIGVYQPYRNTSRQRKSDVLLQPATAERRPAAATTPFFSCWPVLVFAPVRSSLSSSMTSIGEPARLSFEAKDCFTTGCPYLAMWAKR